ncbi:MAG: hypothetical protein SFY81_11505 [Verrucomicrobiota bacterium]|nr:hypothetical protein [Verrucomicrobiota bacterium]
MKQKRVHSCNVFESSPHSRNLWQFSGVEGRVRLVNGSAGPSEKGIPKNLVTKDWHNLIQPRLNLAWLPAEQVFLRVLQLPKADPAEIASMLEFQLEKLSPIPVGQIVWSFELLPGGDTNTQTVLAIIAPRSLVEQFVGALEGEGFKPDRLELPLLYQIVAAPPQSDGIWIYPEPMDQGNLCLVAWWFNGMLQNLQLVHLPSVGDKVAVLREQLDKTAWAGEMEGWLEFPVRIHLVASPAVAAIWTEMLKEWAQGEILSYTPLTKDQAAEFAARRVVEHAPAANLLPSEYGVRYQQEFIDRLWMRGLFAMVGLYLIGVAVYIAVLYGYKFKASRIQTQITQISGSYTNALRLRERVEVLQEQLNLKYAALDSWKVASELLPAELTLNWMVFGRGKSLELHGSAPQEHADKITDYNEALRNVKVEDQPLFSLVSPPTSNSRGGGNLNWSFTCSLNRQELQ